MPESLSSFPIQIAVGEISDDHSNSDTDLEAQSLASSERRSSGYFPADNGASEPAARRPSPLRRSSNAAYVSNGSIQATPTGMRASPFAQEHFVTPSGLQVSTPFASSNGLARLGTGDMRWGDAAPDPLGEADRQYSVDRNGFIIAPGASGDLGAQEDPKEASRRQKWRVMLGAGGADWKAYLARNPAQVKRRVRKGIPNALRSMAWQLLSGSRDLLLQNPGVYDSLLLAEAPEAELEIGRDLSRTYPSHVYYQQRHGPGQKGLLNVLKAYAVYDRQVGYVQGMGFIAGLLLLYMCEEDAFWMLVALLKGAVHHPLEGLYQAGLPLLQQCLHQFSRLIDDEVPRVAAQMRQEGVHPTMYCSHWFITIFAYALPFDHLLRVWDIFFLEGIKTVFRVGLALLKTGEAELAGLPFEGLLHALRAQQLPAFARSANSLVKLALSFRVSRRLDMYRVEYAALAEKGSADFGPGL